MEGFPNKARLLLLSLCVLASLIYAQNEDVKALILQLKTQERPKAEEAARQLKELAEEDGEVLSLLVQHVKDPNPEVRHFAGEIVAKIGDSKSESVLSLLGSFPEEPEPIRREIAWVFLQMGPPPASSLAGLCEREQDPETKLYLTVLLYLAEGKYDDSILDFFEKEQLTATEPRQFFGTLLQYYTAFEGWETARKTNTVKKCVSLMEKSELSQPLHKLCVAVTGEEISIGENADYRKAWNEWLQRPQKEMELKTKIDQWVYSPQKEMPASLLQNLNTQAPSWSRMYCVYQFGRHLSQQKVVEALSRMFDEEQDPQMIEVLASVLAKSPDPDVLDRLFSLLNDDLQLAKYGAELLISMHEREIPARLIECIRQDIPEENKIAILEALPLYENRQTLLQNIPELLDSLEEEDPKVVCSLISLLTQLQAKDACPRLYPLLEDGDPGVRSEAVKALAALKDPEAAGRLAETFAKEKSPLVQTAIFDSLSYCNDRKAILKALSFLPKDYQGERGEKVFDAAQKCASMFKEYCGEEIFKSQELAPNIYKLDRSLLKALEAIDSSKNLANEFVDMDMEARTSLLKILRFQEKDQEILAILKMLPDGFCEWSADLLEEIVDCATLFEGKLSKNLLTRIVTESDKAGPRKDALDPMLSSIELDDSEVLMGLLGDSDLEIRKKSYQKLQELVAPVLERKNIEDFGYDPDGESLERWKAAAQWKRWWYFRKFLPLLASKNQKKREEAREFIQRQDAWVVPFLIKHYQEQSDADSRCKLLRLLANWDTPESIEFLTSVLSSDMWKFAVESLSKMCRRSESVDAQKALLDFWPKVAQEGKTWCAVQISMARENENVCPQASAYLKEQIKGKERDRIFGLLQEQKGFPREIKSELVGFLKDENSRKATAEFLLAIPGRPSRDLLIGVFTSLAPDQRLRLITRMDLAKERTGLKQLADKAGAIVEESVKLAFCKAIRQNKAVAGKKAMSKWLFPASCELQSQIIATLEEFQAVDVALLKDLFEKDTREKSRELFLRTLAKLEQKTLDPYWQKLIAGDYPDAVLVQVAEIICENPKLENLVSDLIAELPKKQSTALRTTWYREMQKVAKFSDEDAAALVKLVEQEQKVKVEAIALLAKVPYQRAEPVLLALIKNGASPEIEKSALAQLVAFGKSEAADELLGLITGNGDWDVALRSAIVKLNPEKGMELLQKAVEKEQPDLEAFSELATIDKQHAQKSLLSVYSKLQNDEQRISFLQRHGNLFDQDNVPWLLQLLNHPLEQMREEAAKILTTVTGESTDYHADASEQVRKDASAPWFDWQEKRETIAGYISEILKNGENRRELREKIIDCGARGVSMLQKELSSPRTAEEKAILVETLSYTKDRQLISVLRKLLTLPSEQVRRETFLALDRLQDPDLPYQLPILYLQETSLLVRVTLLDLMLRHRIVFYREDWKKYLDSKDEGVWNALLELITQHQLVGKKQVLFDKLANIPEGALDKTVAILEQELTFEDIERLADMLAKRPQEKLTAALLSLLGHFPEIPEQALKNAPTFLAWWNDNRDKLGRKVVLAKTMNRFLAKDDFATCKALEELKDKDRKWVEDRLIARYEEKSTSLEQKQRILKLVAGYGTPANADFLTYNLQYEQFLFAIDTKYDRDFADKNISGDLSKVFEKNGCKLSAETTVELEGDKWEIEDKENNKLYSVVRESHSLGIYSEQVNLRYLAAWGLCRIGYKNIPEQIQEAAEHDAPVGFFAVRAMGESGEKSLRDLLGEKSLLAKDARVREEALYWAVQLGFEDSEKLMKLLEDKSYRIRVMAANRLAQIGAKEALGKLMTLLEKDTWPQSQEATCRALIALSGQNIDYLPETKGQSWLALSLEERKKWYRWWLGAKREQGLKKWQDWWIGYQQAQEIRDLAKLFAQENVDIEQVREKILEKYESIPESTKREVTDALIDLLKSPEGKIRLEITKIAGKFKNERWQIALARQLLDPDLHVRQSALSQIDDAPVESPWAFHASDLLDAKGLVRVIEKKTPLSSYIVDRFAPETKKLLDEHKEAMSAELRDALLLEFNRLLTGEPLFDENRFAGVEIGAFTREFFENYPEQTVCANRLLLEDAYPQIRAWRQHVNKIIERWQAELAKNTGATQAKQEVATLLDLAKAQKPEETVAALLALGPKAIDALKGFIEDERPQVVSVVVEALCRWRDFDSVEKIIPLLVNPKVRPAALRSLEKLLGDKAPFAPQGQGKDLYLARLGGWWQRVYQELTEHYRDVRSHAMKEISDNPDPTVFKSQASKMAKLGSGAREILTEYFKEMDEGTVKRSFVSALMEINDPRAIPDLLDDLGNERSDVRCFTLQVIYALAGEKLENKNVPDTEKDWTGEQWLEERQRIEQWWNDSQAKLEAQAKSAIEQLQNKASRDQGIEKLIECGPRCERLVISLCGDKNPELQLAAMKVLKGIGYSRLTPKAIGPALLPLAATDSQTGKMAAEILQTISGADLPDPEKIEVVWQKEVEDLQDWWEEHQAVGTDKEELEKFLISVATAKKLDEKKIQERLLAFGAAFAKDIQIYYRSSNDTLRLGSVRICTLPTCPAYSLIKPLALRKLLLDPNTMVREQAMLAIQKREKLPQADLYRRDFDEQWLKQATVWFEKWEGERKQLRKNKELESLDKDAGPLLESEKLKTKEQIEAARKVISYLENPDREVSVHALTILKKFAGGEIEFDPSAAQEQRQDALKNIREWLGDIEKEIADQTQGMQEKVAEFDKKWAALAKKRDLIEVLQCQSLLALTREMLNEEFAHPIIQEKFLEILQNNGCQLPQYNVYAGRKQHKKILQGLRSEIYDRREELKKIAQDGKKEREMLSSLFELGSIVDERDIEKAKKLVGLLAHPYYPLRQDAIDTLAKLLTGDEKNKGYNAKLLPEKNGDAIQAWKNWVEQQSIKLQQKRVELAKEVKLSCARLQKIGQIKWQSDFKHAQRLVTTLKDQDKSLRIEALDALKVVAGKDFGYEAEKSPAKQEKSLSDWTKWLSDQENLVREREDLLEVARRVKDGERVITVEQAKDVSTLICALESAHLDFNEIALQALESYAKKYDPKAPVNASKDHKKVWQAWYDASIALVVEREKKCLEQIKQWEQQLSEEDIISLSDWKAANALVEYLSDASLAVRRESNGVLKRFTGDKFNPEFEPAASFDSKRQALSSWKRWLEKQKRALIKSAARKIAAGTEIKTSVQSDDMALLIEGLNSPALVIRQIAFNALLEYVRKYAAAQVREGFGYDPGMPREQCVKEWQNWFAEKIKPQVEQENK